MFSRPLLSFSLVAATAVLLAACNSTPDAGAPTGSGAAMSAKSSSTQSVGRFAYLRDAMNQESSSSTSSAMSQSSTSSVRSMGVGMVASTTTRSSSGVTVASSAQQGTSSVWSSEGENLSISLTPDRIEAYPGDEILYTIVVCNRTWEELRNVGVSFRFNMEEMRVIAISDNGRLIENITSQKLIRYAPVRDSVPPSLPVVVKGQVIEEPRAAGQKMGRVIAQAPSTFGRVDWVIERLGPGESKKLTVRVRLSDLLKQGQVVRTESILNDKPRPGQSIVKAMSDLRIITRIPDTGAEIQGDAGPSMEPPLPGQMQK